MFKTDRSVYELTTVDSTGRNESTRYPTYEEASNALEKLKSRHYLTTLQLTRREILQSWKRAEWVQIK